MKETYRINKYEPDLEANDGSWRYYTKFEECKRLFSGLRYSDIKPDDNGDCIMIPYSSGSDYSGTTTELSNFQCIKEDFSEFVLEVWGGHGTFGLLVNIDDLENIPELQELFEKLDNYPVYDEDSLSLLEAELLDKVWEDWADWDFQKLLSDNNIEIDDDKKEQLFWDSLRLANENGDAEPIYENNSSPYIDIEQLLPYVQRILKGYIK